MKKKLSLNRETVRHLDGPQLNQVQGGDGIGQLTTEAIRKTIATVLSAATLCQSECITDPPTCLCPSFDCDR